MAEEEAARMREDEEALAADMDSDEQHEGDSGDDVDEEEDHEKDESRVGQPLDVAHPAEAAENTEEDDNAEQENIDEDDEAVPETPPILTAQTEKDDEPAGQQDPAEPTGVAEEEIDQPEQVVADEVPTQQEGSASEDDEVLEVTAAEVPTSTRPPRTRTTSAAPSRTNPLQGRCNKRGVLVRTTRKAKAVAVSISPTFTVHAPPKAKQRVAFSLDDEEAQEEGQADHLANPPSAIDHLANLVSEEHVVTASSASEQPDEEIKAEEPDVEVDQVDSTAVGDEMDKGTTAEEEVDVDEAAKQRQRNGKAKALPTQKTKSIARVTRRTGGPVLREPAGEIPL